MEKLLLFFIVLMSTAQFSMPISLPMPIITDDDEPVEVSVRSKKKFFKELDFDAGPYQEKDRQTSPSTGPVRFMQLDCTSPMDLANCESTLDRSIKRWAYLPKIGYCQPFWKGACGGNNNAYETESECQATCAPFRYFPARTTERRNRASDTTVKQESTAVDPATEEQKPIMRSDDVQIIIFNDGLIENVNPGVPRTKETKTTDKAPGHKEKRVIKRKNGRNKRTRTNVDADVNFRARDDMPAGGQRLKNKAVALPSFF